MMDPGNAGMSVKMLFGENMMCCLPRDSVDVSEIRDVPDNQEVFTHPKSDQSIIVDILEHVQESDEEALKTHFQEIARSNEAEGPENAKIISYELIPLNQIALQDCAAAYFLIGQQMVSKFNESSKNVVNIYMTLFRLPERETDIVVTMNDPEAISPQSSSHNPGNDLLGKWTSDELKSMVLSLKIMKPDFLG